MAKNSSHAHNTCDAIVWRSTNNHNNNNHNHINSYSNNNKHTYSAVRVYAQCYYCVFACTQTNVYIPIRNIQLCEPRDREQEAETGWTMLWYTAVQWKRTIQFDEEKKKKNTKTRQLVNKTITQWEHKRIHRHTECERPKRREERQQDKKTTTYTDCVYRK